MVVASPPRATGRAAAVLGVGRATRARGHSLEGPADGGSLPEENPVPQSVPWSLGGLQGYLPAPWGMALPTRHAVLSLQ